MRKTGAGGSCVVGAVMMGACEGSVAHIIIGDLALVYYWGPRLDISADPTPEYCWRGLRSGILSGTPLWHIINWGPRPL